MVVACVSALVALGCCAADDPSDPSPGAGTSPSEAPASSKYSAEEIAAAQPSERRGMRANVRAQRGWFVLSPRAEQVVVTTGHAVEEADPQLVIDAILDVVTAARGG